MSIVLPIREWSYEDIAAWNRRFFFTATSLLLNAQRRRIWSVAPSPIRKSYKWSSQPHVYSVHKLIILSSSSRFHLFLGVWIPRSNTRTRFWFITSTSKIKDLENAYRNLVNAHLVCLVSSENLPDISQSRPRSFCVMSSHRSEYPR